MPDASCARGIGHNTPSKEGAIHAFTGVFPVIGVERKAFEDLLAFQDKITAELAKGDPEALGGSPGIV